MHLPFKHLLSGLFVVINCLSMHAQSENLIITPEYIPIQDCSLRQKNLSQPLDSLLWWTDTVCSQVDLELLHIQMKNRNVQSKIDSTLTLHFQNFLFLNLDCSEYPALEFIRDSIFTEGRFIHDHEYIAFIQMWLEKNFIEMNLGMYEMNRNENILTISVSYDSYSGGAHPLHESTILNFNTHTGEVLTLTDCIDESTIPMLTSVAFSQFSQLDPDSLWGLDEPTFFLSDDFFFDESGLHFFYDPYEIGPYVMGSPEIHLPLEKIQPLISPNSVINAIYK
jgi:hypothetical protein